MPASRTCACPEPELLNWQPAGAKSFLFLEVTPVAASRVDPFDPDSPLKKMGVKEFPGDMFFVLRVVQLLRGLATHMGVTDFSSASQWRNFADDALIKGGRLPPRKPWWLTHSAF